MIHFDFIVTEDEAETIFNAFEDELSKLRAELAIPRDSMRQKWTRDRIIYLLELKRKITNSKVPESVGEEQAIPVRSSKE